MHQLNIHWKCRPHHHFPRIGVTSANRPSFPSRSIRSTSQHTVKQALLRPPIPATNERRKSRFKIPFRRRKGRRTKSSSLVQARKRGSIRARQHIQVFGWNTPLADLASKATTEKTELNSSPSPHLKTANLIPEATDIDSISTTTLTTTDVAGSAVLKQVQLPKNEPQNVYSLMHAAEVPVYTRDTQKRRKSPSHPDRSSIHSRKRTESAYLRPLESNGRRRSTYNGLGPLDRSRTYDIRVNPHKRAQGNRRKFTPSVGRGAQATAQRNKFRPSAKKTQKSFGSAAFWGAADTVQSRPKTQKASNASGNSPVESASPEIHSRTASQKKALSRFTRELELHLRATRDLPKQSLVLSPSTTTVSAHTISEFRPYQDVFQAAGLAVTSAEQRRIIDLKSIPLPPATPLKDKKYQKMAELKKPIVPKKKKEKRGSPSSTSDSTGTTVIGWTPPHEKSYPRQKSCRPPLDNSSNNTIAAFSSHERMVLQPAKAVTTPLTSKKKSLPWLRRPEPISGAVSPTNVITPIELEEGGRTIPLGGLITMSGSRKDTERAEKKSGQATNPGTVQCSKKIRRGDTKSTVENVTRPIAKGSPTQRKAYATQPDPVSFVSADTTNHLNVCTDMATQTMESDVEEASLHSEKLVVERAPFSRGHSKSFPVKSNHWKDEGQGTHVESQLAHVAAGHSRLSSVRWQEMKNATQTEEPQPKLIERPKVSHQKTEIFFPSIERIDQRSKPYPKSQGLVGGSFQPTSALRGSHKSVDESEGPTNEQANVLEKLRLGNRSPKSSPPSRRAPSLPPLCPLCAGSLIQEIPEAEIEIELEPAEFSRQRFRPSHSCTARSSLQCQQCYPSRDASPKIPLPPLSSTEVKYKVEDRSRSSTRPIIPVNVPYIRDISRRSAWELNDISPPSPEAKTTQTRCAKKCTKDYPKGDAVPELETRPSLSRLWLKAAPSPLEPSIQQSMCSIPTAMFPKNPPKQPQQPTSQSTSPPTIPDYPFSSLSSLDSTFQMDRKVIKGLQVATAAACDEDVDRWIEEIAGCGVRRFLADLSAFEGLGTNTLASVAKRASKQRRERVRAWEALREKRGLEVEGREGRRLDRRLGVVAGDQSERLRSQEGCPMGGERSEGWLEEDLMIGDLGVFVAGKKSNEDLSSERSKSRGREEEMKWRLK